MLKLGGQLAGTRGNGSKQVVLGPGGAGLMRGESKDREKSSQTVHVLIISIKKLPIN
jgi:hypothetical protein